MVHDTENLTVSEEFWGCSARTPAAELLHRWMRIPRGRTRIFCAGGHGSSVRIRVENGGNQNVNFVRNNRLKDRETRHKDRLNYHYRNRSGHEI